jgi:citrate lyase alpha subunit
LQRPSVSGLSKRFSTTSASNNGKVYRTGAPRPVEFNDEFVGLIEYLDGTIIDTVRTVRE